MGLNVQEAGRPVDSYEGSAGIGQIVGFAAEFAEICSRNGSMTDLTMIGMSKDGTTNPARIGRDHITDSAEISGRGLSYDSPAETSGKDM